MAVDEPLEERCAVCGVALTSEELLANRESASATLLCTTHALEVIPLEDEDPGV